VKGGGRERGEGGGGADLEVVKGSGVEDEPKLNEITCHVIQLYVQGQSCLLLCTHISE